MKFNWFILLSLFVSIDLLHAQVIQEVWELDVTHHERGGYLTDFVASGDGKGVLILRGLEDIGEGQAFEVVVIGEGKVLFRHAFESVDEVVITAVEPTFASLAVGTRFPPPSSYIIGWRGFAIVEGSDGYELMEPLQDVEFRNVTSLASIGSRFSDGRGMFVPLENGVVKRMEIAETIVLRAHLASGQSTLLDWVTIAQKSYLIQSSTDLLVWATENIVVGDGSRRSYFVNGDAISPRYYRVVEAE
jgi:hypothetical protein